MVRALPGRGRCGPARSLLAAPSAAAADAAATVEQIAALRRQCWTGNQIARQVGVSPATVSRVLRRRGLSWTRDLEPAAPIRRYEREQPGELIHLDIKKLGQFEQVGHRITGDRTGQNRAASAGSSSTSASTTPRASPSPEILPDERGERRRLPQAAVAYYASLGVTVVRVMTDNGSCYRAKAFPEPAGGSASSTSAPGPTRPGPTARPSASSRPRCANGPTPGLSDLDAPRCRAAGSGSTATTGIGQPTFETEIGWG